MPHANLTSRLLSALLAALLAGPGCAHLVRLDTTPSGATVTVNGVHHGETPTDFREYSGWERRYRVEISKPGYEPVREEIRQKEWDMRVAAPSALAGLVTFGLGFAGLLWSRRCRHGYHWDLVAAPGEAPPPPAAKLPSGQPLTGAGEPIPEGYPEPPEPEAYPDPDSLEPTR